METVRNYIRFGQYYEALNLLTRMPGRDAEWFFLSAQANLGVGQPGGGAGIRANRPCAWIDQRPVPRVPGAVGKQRRTIPILWARLWRHSQALCHNPCLTICLANMLCRCCVTLLITMTTHPKIFPPGAFLPADFVAHFPFINLFISKFSHMLTSQFYSQYSLYFYRLNFIYLPYLCRILRICSNLQLCKYQPISVLV